jgi:general secretion pathway protein K
MNRALQRPARAASQGVALLAAMLTVTLVATLAATALWQQWRSVEIETAERARIQSAWVLTGALDWSRLILREDLRAGGPDHLAEPWATPLAEARLSSFLSLDKTTDDDTQEAFLSGRISDAQAKLNVTNLVQGQKISAPALRAFGKLFELLGVPPDQLQLLAESLRLALDTRPENTASATAPLLPQRVEQLTWLGLSRANLALLSPYITLLPVPTPVNLNTASAEVISAVFPGMDLSSAKRLVLQRARSPYRTRDEAVQALRGFGAQIDDNQHAVATRYFEVHGRLRLDQTVLEERSLVQRTGTDVMTLWRERWVGDPASAVTP